VFQEAEEGTSRLRALNPVAGSPCTPCLAPTSGAKTHPCEDRARGDIGLQRSIEQCRVGRAGTVEGHVVTDCNTRFAPAAQAPPTPPSAVWKPLRFTRPPMPAAACETALGAGQRARDAGASAGADAGEPLISLATRVPTTRRLRTHCATSSVQVRRFATDAICEALHRRQCEPSRSRPRASPRLPCSLDAGRYPKQGCAARVDEDDACRPCAASRTLLLGARKGVDGALQALPGDRPSHGRTAVQ